MQLHLLRWSPRNPQGHSFIALLSSITKISQLPKNTKYPQNINSLGDHIRKRRLDLELEQKEVAKIIDVTESCIWNWENNRYEPRISHYPAIMNFLGYCPYVRVRTWGDRIRLHRTHMGISCKKFAKIISVDSASILRWENRANKPWKKLVEKVEAYFLQQR
ncbi:helix-turn-helix domain-containing protein [Desulforhopalus singaporensis]|uniref:helix-turn-helix domain-containing protein n=1 Tax=Desulforhopalus singaporensis TaxID=91360 RepID=UPI0038B3005E